MKSNVNVGKGWTAMDRLLIIWKSDLSDKIKSEFFQTGTYCMAASLGL